MKTSAVMAAILVLGMVLVGADTVAQTRPKTPPRPTFTPGHTLQGHFERQFTQIDQLIRLGHLSRAHALLEELATAGGPQESIRKRRVKIALAAGEEMRAVELCREALAANAADAEIWRQLATAHAALAQPDSARAALDRYLALAGESQAGMATAVDVLATAGDHAGTVALVDSARTVLGDPAFLARRRAVALLALGRGVEAAGEVRSDLGASPYNLPFLRRELLDTGLSVPDPSFAAELVRMGEQPGAIPELSILAANLALARGDAVAALALVTPHLERPATARAALTNASMLVTELPVVAERTELAAQTSYLLDVLPRLATLKGIETRHRLQALDQLASVCVFALQQNLLGADPLAATERFGELLALVRQGHPESAHLYVAQIELARFTRERLRDPATAAARLERLLLDLDLPLEGVALARLALGESLLAARDTSRARQVLTALGRDTHFRLSAGHAHFLLARLDLAQGHLVTAGARFAAVGLDDPAAPYANDALQIGLIVAEELQNPTGGPDLLMRYARSLWFELVAEPDSQAVALRAYLDRAVQQVDFNEPQPLVEHARFELAHLLRQSGRLGQALAQLDRIVLDQPDGRLAPRALAVRGEILADERLDVAGARREYERLLAQYPDDVFATEIRQRLRELP